MVSGLGIKFCEERLKELIVFSMEKKKCNHSFQISEELSQIWNTPVHIDSRGQNLNQLVEITRK